MNISTSVKISKGVARNQLDIRRDEARNEYERKLAGIERTERVYDAAESLLAEWKASDAGRDGRIYIGEGSMHLTLELARPDIFASAEDHFDRCQREIRAVLPAEWHGEWGDIKDKSDSYEARKQSVLTIGPKPNAWFDGGLLLILRVTARIGPDSACQIIQIGETEVEETRRTKKLVPVYQAVCRDLVAAAAASAERVA